MSVPFYSSLLSSSNSPCACLSELQPQKAELLPPWRYGHCSLRPGVSKGGAEMGERRGTLVLGFFCATILNGFIMQSSRHQGDVWSHNGTRANIIQIFSQSKFKTRPKRGGGRREDLKKRKNIHAYLLHEINSYCIKC